jgi:hypothetical protein
MADFVLSQNGTGNLKAICPVCEGWMFRRVSAAKIAAVAAGLDVQVVDATSRLWVRPSLSVNCD